MSKLPPAVLEQVEQAFVNVLRRRYPDAVCIVRDIGEGEAPVLPADLDASLEIAARASRDADAVEEASENGSTLERVEAVPQHREGATDGKPSSGGG